MNSGLVTKNSPHNVETTYDKIKTILTNNPNLKILLELDHSKNAASVGLDLRSTKIILFGNPKLGTPLMQASATTSIDLPQKIVVYEGDDGKAVVVYNDPLYLKERHHITGADEILAKVSGALGMITDKAVEG